MLKYFIIIVIFSYFVSKCSSVEQVLKTNLITRKTFVFWPNATVPFFIQPNHFDQDQIVSIMTSLSMFAFKTCLKFAPVMEIPKERQHVMVFVNPEGVRRCRVQTVGHSYFDSHLVTLGYDCLKSPEIDMFIMRALGFPFEHNRMSRDVYIDVLIENIEPGSVDLFTKESILPHELRELPYDINSVMHFGERDYSKNGHKTIMFKTRGIRQNRVGLTPTDLRKIEIVYGPECVARDRQEKVELCQSYPGVARRKRHAVPPANKSLRVNPDITPPPSPIPESTEPEPFVEDIQKGQDAEYLTQVLKNLGIANETEEIIEKVYKISASALKNAHEKYCNVSVNATVPEIDLNKGIRKRNSSDLLGIIEVIADYSRSMVASAVQNLTIFCQTSENIEIYQRQCSWSFGNNRCPQNYRSTKSGPVRYSTQHRPIYKQQTKHMGAVNKYSYDKNGGRRLGDDEKTTTPVVSIRRKREVAETPKQEDVKQKKQQKEKKILKERKKEKLGGEKENTTVKFKIVTPSSKSKAKKEEKDRRFFQERRYKVKNPQDASEPEWEESNISLDKDKDVPKPDNADEDIQDKKDQEIDDERDKEREEEDLKDKEIERAADKIIDKEELVKEVINEGLDKILIDKTLAEKELLDKSTEELEESKEEDEVIEESKAIDEGVKDIEPEKELKNIDSEKELGVDVEQEVLDVMEESDVETTTEKKKRHMISADKEVLDYEVAKTKEKEERLQQGGKGNIKQRKRSRSVPKTVKLNKLNEEFYNERRWPDRVVRYVIKRIPEYDLEDLRNRLAEVNSILTRRTCVRLREVDSKEADGYDDYLVLDTSPDYVTGRVGGKQIFGCVELFRGGQHRQHTAMMVMAMLGFYFEVSRHDRDRHIRVHMRHVRPDKLHHFEKIRDEATLDIPYDYKSATHPAWQFWRKIGKTGISTVATFKEQDPDGSVMRSLGQNAELLSEGDILKINSVYGVDCFLESKEKNTRASNKKKAKKSSSHKLKPIQ